MLGDILYTLIIGPLETLFEFFFIVLYRITQNPGYSIIGLSLLMNLLLLPLYNRTDAIQAQAIETEKHMRPFVKHIKQHFHGPEQFMILETYYRQNHYKPYDVLKGIAPLALEIPFFMAAYHFLSHLDVLVYSEFFYIQDLSQPDSMLQIQGINIHFLPVLMTVINLISSFLYTKGAPIKTKIQLYGMAGLFLILLYDSPSGLVLYWTLNNLFSLIKNILVRTKKPLRTTSICFSVLSFILFAYFLKNRASLSSLRGLILLALIVSLNFPLLFFFWQSVHSPKSKHFPQNGCYGSFLLAQAILALMIGTMVPSVLIDSSPLEFLSWNQGGNIHSYVLHTGLLSIGACLIWGNLFFLLLKPSIRKPAELLSWILCGVAMTDYMFFGKGYGNLSSQLVFDQNIQVSVGSILLNLAVLAAVISTIILLFQHKKDLLMIAGTAALIAVMGISVFSIISAKSEIENNPSQSLEARQPDGLFTLSQSGKNVVILMMDRAVGQLVPYIMEERPELLDQFDGFTYYPNTLSFGAHTNFGLPGVFGGYEYTPLQMNLRSNKPLSEKHNEALLMLPLLFSREGYKTTVCDPTYADYAWKPQTEIFDPYPDIEAHITMGTYSGFSAEDMLDSQTVMQRKFLYYSLFRCAPVALHRYLYDGGRYQNIQTGSQTGQVCSGLLTAEGENIDFSNSYSVLKYLPALTEITPDPADTFLMMCNDTTHSPQMLQLPQYTPSMQVDNQAFEASQPYRVDSRGNRISFTDPLQVMHYHCNMASFIQIGKWLDYLRENHVYDNTRIILVGDHGYNLNLNSDLLFTEDTEDDITFYNPLLMVKDFGADKAFSSELTEMTNADTPSLATADILDNPVNPFTDNPIDPAYWNHESCYVSLSHLYSTSVNNGNTFIPDRWARVEGPMMDRDSWHIIAQTDAPLGK